MELSYKTTCWCKCGQNPHPHKPHNESSGKAYRHTVTNIRFCCEEMEVAFKDKFVVFGDIDDEWSDNKINIVQCSVYPEGSFFSIMEIKYCPFCSEKIQLITS